MRKKKPKRRVQAKVREEPIERPGMTVGLWTLWPINFLLGRS